MKRNIRREKWKRGVRKGEGFGGDMKCLRKGKKGEDKEKEGGRERTGRKVKAERKNIERKREAVEMRREKREI